MELIEGVSMRQICGEPHPASQVANSGDQVALALAAAHAAGIVHRDIKPENLMLRPDGFVKVLDFGLARRTEGSILNSASVGFAGTLRYMSPEQVRGDSPKPASDIFTLGIVLYELATGVHPFASGSPSPPESDALLAPYLITALEPRRAAEIELSVPAELDALIMAMLEKDAAKRPTAEHVADRLLAVQGSTAGVKKRRGWRFPAAAVPRAAVAGLALCVALGATLFWRCESSRCLSAWLR